MSILDNPEFLAAHEISAKEYHKAKMRLVEKEPKDALACARYSMEALVKSLYNHLGMTMVNEEGYTFRLIELLDHLRESDILTNDEVSFLHKFRIASNKGSHPDEAPPTQEEAENCVGKLEAALEILYSKFEKNSACTAENNSPASATRYYNPLRKYRGAWASCYSREKLYENDDYVSLSARAENGEVDAMLDLAIGFLPKNPVWGKEQLVCMPKYYDKRTNREYYNAEYDAPDTRYYYWIMSACNRLLEEGVEVKDSHKKYIATALFEGIKYKVHRGLIPSGYRVSSVHNGVCEYQDVDDLAKRMFGSVKENALDWHNKLIEFIDEAKTCDIIDPLHQHNRSINGLIFLNTCICYIDKVDVSYEETDPAGNPVEYIGPVTMKYLEKTRPDNDGGYFYFGGAVRTEMYRRKAEEKRQKDEAYAKALKEANKKSEAKKDYDGCGILIVLFLFFSFLFIARLLLK